LGRRGQAERSGLCRRYRPLHGRMRNAGHDSVFGGGGRKSRAGHQHNQNQDHDSGKMELYRKDNIGADEVYACEEFCYLAAPLTGKEEVTGKS